MFCHQKYSGVAKGFLLGSLLVFSIMFFGSNLKSITSPAASSVPFDEAAARFKSDDIEEVRISEGTAEFLKDEQVAFATGVSEEQIVLLLEQAKTGSKTVQFMPVPKSGNPFGYLIQILFWLFFISPPVIVVLLLVIIKKLDANRS